MADVTKAGATAGKAAWTAPAARAARHLVVFLALFGLSACSSFDKMSMSDILDPFGIFSDDEPEQIARTPTSAPTAGSATEERFPNLARVPPRPVEQSSSGERRRAIDSLTSDRNNARYTDEELRGRPPQSNALPPAPPPPTTALPSVSTPRQAAAPMPPTGAGPAPQPDGFALQPPRPTQPVIAAPPPAFQQPQFASAPPAGSAPQPSGPPVNMGQVYLSNLQASAVTTLPPNLAQVQPAAAAGPTVVSSGGVMTPSAAPPAAAGAFGAPPQGRTLLAIVRFGNGSTSLDARDKALLRQVAEYQKGVASGAGLLRVVGHASSRTADMVASRNRQTNFELSRTRAEAVAAELRRLRVDPRLIQVEARADAAPVYYEAMPAAEDANRRVEIYLER